MRVGLLDTRPPSAAGIDGCDGHLDFYCNECRRFVTAAKCEKCESNAREAEKRQLRERKARVVKLLSITGTSPACSSLRRWPGHEMARKDFVDRGGLARQQTFHSAMMAGLAGLTLCVAAWLRVVLWPLITVRMLFVLCFRTLRAHCPPDVWAAPSRRWGT